MGNNNSNMPSKSLVAFDFDHTVMDANTDIEVQILAEDGRIPPDIRQLYSNKCWTDFMQAIFVLLHNQGVNVEQYKNCLHKIVFVPGMKELLRKLGAFKDRVEVLIISDSNSFFIEEILKHHSLNDSVTKIFTNPAWFDDTGCLRIKYFHEQTDCDLSTKNLCKGMILKDYVKARERDGIKFGRIVYVGDGKNDLCPALKLSKRDHLFARRGYTLETMLKTAEHKERKLAAAVHYFQTAYEISEFMGFGGCAKEPDSVVSMVVDNPSS